MISASAERERRSEQHTQFPQKDMRYNMFTLNSTKAVAQNEVVINGFSVGFVSDRDAEKLYSIVKAMMNGDTVKNVTPNSNPKVSTKPSKSKLNAKDAKVSLTRKKNVVTLDNSVGKDTFGILRKIVEEDLGGAYRKGEGFVFKPATVDLGDGKGEIKRTAVQLASFFAGIKDISAAERNEYRKTQWGWS